MEEGRYGNGYRYVRIGEGRKLVVIPGVDDEMVRWSRFPRILARRFSDMDREIVYVSRKEDMDAETTQEIAQEYAEVLEEEGAADVIGLSLGGMVAQHLALESENVRKLVIAFSGIRVEGVDGWLELLGEDRIGEYYSAVAKDTFTGLKRFPISVLSRIFWRWLPSPPIDDLENVVRAAKNHDTTLSARRIDRETSVIGARRDKFFPPRIIEETADIIGGDTAYVEGGHAAFVENRASFHRKVEEFLD